MVSPKSLLGKFLGIDYATGDLTGQGPSGVLVPILRGGNNNVAVVTATSVAITRDSHDMKDIVLNRAGGNAPTSFSAGSTADTISLNGTTTGGKKGDHFALTVVASNQWAAYGEIQATGASATPFVVSVS
jgi:hypothetical protein